MMAQVIYGKVIFFNAFTEHGLRACNSLLVKALAAYEIPIYCLNCCVNCEHFPYKDIFCTSPERTPIGERAISEVSAEWVFIPVVSFSFLLSFAPLCRLFCIERRSVVASFIFEGLFRPAYPRLPAGLSSFLIAPPLTMRVWLSSRWQNTYQSKLSNKTSPGLFPVASQSSFPLDLAPQKPSRYSQCELFWQVKQKRREIAACDLLSYLTRFGRCYDGNAKTKAKTIDFETCWGIDVIDESKKK